MNKKILGFLALALGFIAIAGAGMVKADEGEGGGAPVPVPNYVVVSGLVQPQLNVITANIGFADATVTSSTKTFIKKYDSSGTVVGTITHFETVPALAQGQGHNYNIPDVCTAGVHHIEAWSAADYYNAISESDENNHHYLIQNC